MSDTQRIKDNIDIVGFISEYVQLKPAGVNKKGLCPFHKEKSPSFMVSAERQRWHCFGCSKGGDIFEFVQEIEGMDFIEALKFLADRAGIELTQKQSDYKSNERNRIKEINQVAAVFFHNVLMKMDASKAAREYLSERGLTQETIQSWQIGFIPDQWDLLTKYLLKKGYSIDDLVASGLTIKREGADSKSGKGFYDRFRGRIMFPICDVHDVVVGFTGRVLVETEKSGGKYVNTPQTLVYDKSRVIFGLNKAKKSIRQKNIAVITEGQTDVIASHQAGMTNVCASSGTALTEHQITLLKRYSNNLYAAFDGDAAGIKAAKRGIDLALAAGMHVRVIQIPEGAGKDPDECIRKNKHAWFEAVDSAQDIMQWYLDTAFKHKDINDPRQKQAIANEILQEIARIPHAVEQDHWLQELAGRLHVDVAVLRQDLARVAKSQKADVHTATHVAKSETPRIIQKEKKQSDRLEQLHERIFALWIRFHGLFPEDWCTKLETTLSTSQYVGLYEMIKKQYTLDSSIDIEQFRASLEQGSTAETFDKLLLKSDLLFPGFTQRNAKEDIEQVIKHIHDEWLYQERLRLQHDIATAEKSGDKKRLQELLLQFQLLQ